MPGTHDSAYHKADAALMPSVNQPVLRQPCGAMPLLIDMDTRSPVPFGASGALKPHLAGGAWVDIMGRKRWSALVKALLFPPSLFVARDECERLSCGAAIQPHGSKHLCGLPQFMSARARSSLPPCPCWTAALPRLFIWQWQLGLGVLPGAQGLHWQAKQPGNGLSKSSREWKWS